MSDRHARRTFAATLPCVFARIVIHVGIRDLLHVDRRGLAADHLLHRVVPVLVVSRWVPYAPRRLTVLFPLTWFVFTPVRGSIVDRSPSRSVDVTHLGRSVPLVAAA